MNAEKRLAMNALLVLLADVVEECSLSTDECVFSEVDLRLIVRVPDYVDYESMREKVKRIRGLIGWK